MTSKTKHKKAIKNPMVCGKCSKTYEEGEGCPNCYPAIIIYIGEIQRKND